MACFTVPVAEAIVTTVITKVIESKEKKVLMTAENETAEVDHAVLAERVEKAKARMPFIRKMKWLNYMLWGGSALLAFEHVWHGEVVPWFPFLTNAANPEDAAEMMHEIGTTGVLMAVLVTAVWVGIVAVTNHLEKKKTAEESISAEK